MKEIEIKEKKNLISTLNSFDTDDFMRFVVPYLGKQPNWGFGDMSFAIYLRSYSRDVTNPDGSRRKEYYAETVRDCILGAQDLGADYSTDEAKRLFKYMWEFKCLYAGRMLWQLGTETVKKIGMNSLLNCWHVVIKDINSILFLFDNLMLGGGVGFSLRHEDIYKLPPIKKGVKIELKNTKDADFIVPDSREGWVKLIKKVLTSYFVTGKSFTYSTILIRGYGETVSSFGGVASGPIPLINGVDNICKVLSQSEGKQAKSVVLLDVCNILGKIVDAGNIRRGAEIAVGEAEDTYYLKAKRWDVEEIPNWRAISNNSVYCGNINELLPMFWEGYEGKGEPYGLINLGLAKKRGRIKDGYKNDEKVKGPNPCGEIFLEDKECCDLSEAFLTNINSLEEFIDIVKLLYKANKAILNNRFIDEETQKVVKKNQRIGISVSGIYQCIKEGTKLKWLDPCYKALDDYDKYWSNKKGWNPSIKLTTMKPSGTISNLAGTTHGGNAGKWKIYNRTVRMSSNDPVVKYCRDRGYYIEYLENFDGSIDRDTVIVYFPIKLGENATCSDEITAIDQLEMLKFLQNEWSDNAVSITVDYKLEELPAIKEWLNKNYKDNIKSVSFMLHRGHGFKQAPYQEINEDEYNKIVKNLKPVDISKYNFVTDLKSLVSDCDSGSCGLNDIVM